MHLDPHVILFHMKENGENMILDIDKIEFIRLALLLNIHFASL